MYVTAEPGEQILCSIMMISGLFFFSFILSVTLRIVKSANASESKYDELINQLNEYMRNKNFPTLLRSRLLLYYENRFQKHYFKENAILSTLSEHLKYEMFLHTCKGLVEKVSLFHGLSKTVVGSIVAVLKHEVYLPNDLICKAGAPGDCMYFINFGTVAIVLPNGREYCHLEDGDHFGEICIVLDDSHQVRTANVIAIEITEVFKLDKKDFKTYVKNQEQILKKLEKTASERYRELSVLEERATEDNKKRYNVVHELRQGRILEHSLRKR